MASRWMCFWSIVASNDGTLALVWFGFWIMIIAVCIVVAIQFILQLVGADNNRSRHAANKQKRKRFDCLIVVTIFIVLYSMIVYFIYGLFRVYYCAYDKMNETNDCKNGIGMNQDTFYYHYSLNFLFFAFAGSYVSILMCYYWRLLLIFDASIFELTQKKKVIFYVSISATISFILLARIWAFIPDLEFLSDIFAPMFIVCFIFSATYLCICFQQQFKLLLKDLTANGSIETTTNNSNNNNNNYNDSKRIRFYITMRRLTIVTYFSLVTSLIAFVASAIVDIIFELLGNGHTTASIIVQVSMYLLDFNVNLYCIMIQFPNYAVSIVYDKICSKLEKLCCYQKMEKAYNIEANLENVDIGRS